MLSSSNQTAIWLTSSGSVIRDKAARPNRWRCLSGVSIIQKSGALLLPDGCQYSIRGGVADATRDCQRVTVQGQATQNSGSLNLFPLRIHLRYQDLAIKAYKFIFTIILRHVFCCTQSERRQVAVPLHDKITAARRTVLKEGHLRDITLPW